MITRRHFQTSDGVSLATYFYEPAHSSAKGTILHIHGFNEHAGYYEKTWTTVASRGYRLLSYDLRAHGHSEGPRCKAISVSRHAQDFNELIKNYRAITADGFFLLGHSLGALIALEALKIARPLTRALILLSPALRPGPALPGWARFLSKGLYSILPNFPVPQVYGEDVLTSLPSEQERVRRDPFFQSCSTPASFVEIFSAGARLEAEGCPPDLPILLVAGAKDRLCDPEAMQRFTETQTHNVKKLLEPNSRHVPLMDVAADVVLARILDWLDDQATTAQKVPAKAETQP